eukprot:322744-Pelagomonas_calceolata.AAC.1
MAIMETTIKALKQGKTTKNIKKEERKTPTLCWTPPENLEEERPQMGLKIEKMNQMNLDTPRWLPDASGTPSLSWLPSCYGALAKREEGDSKEE